MSVLGRYAYPTAYLQASALLHSILNNHPLYARKCWPSADDWRVTAPAYIRARADSRQLRSTTMRNYTNITRVMYVDINEALADHDR